MRRRDLAELVEDAALDHLALVEAGGVLVKVDDGAAKGEGERERVVSMQGSRGGSAAGATAALSAGSCEASTSPIFDLKSRLTVAGGPPIPHAYPGSPPYDSLVRFGCDLIALHTLPFNSLSTWTSHSSDRPHHPTAAAKDAHTTCCS
jgi:hypothetical protein